MSLMVDSSSQAAQD